MFKRVDGSGGKDMLIGPYATTSQLDRMERAVRSEPRAWIAQRTVSLSTSPTWIDGQIGAAPCRLPTVRRQRR